MAKETERTFYEIKLLKNNNKLLSVGISSHLSENSILILLTGYDYSHSHNRNSYLDMRNKSNFGPINGISLYRLNYGQIKKESFILFFRLFLLLRSSFYFFTF